MQQQVGYFQTAAPVSSPGAVPVAPPGVTPGVSQVILVTSPKRKSNRFMVVENYKKGKSKKIGIAVVVFGLLAIIFSAANLAVQVKRRYYIYVPYTGYYSFTNYVVNAGSGIWAGVFYIISGSLAMGAYNRPTVSMIRGILAMTIISIVFGFTDFALAVTGLASDASLEYQGDSATSSEELEDVDENNRQASVALCSMSMLVAATMIGLLIALADLSGNVICSSEPLPQAPQVAQHLQPAPQVVFLNNQGMPQTPMVTQQNAMASQQFAVPNQYLSQQGPMVTPTPTSVYENIAYQGPPSYESLEPDEKVRQ